MVNICQHGSGDSRVKRLILFISGINLSWARLHKYFSYYNNDKYQNRDRQLFTKTCVAVNFRYCVNGALVKKPSIRP